MALYQAGNSNLARVWAHGVTPGSLDDAIFSDGYEGGDRPTDDELNTLFKVAYEKINHVLTNGIPLWNNSTTYPVGAVVTHSSLQWVCLLQNSNSTPAFNNTNWLQLPTVNTITGPGIIGGKLTNNASNPTTTLDISATTCRAVNAPVTLSRASASKTLATYTAASTGGGLFSGTAAADTVYGVFIIRDGVSGNIFYGFDTSPTADNRPANHTYYRRIGWVLTNGAGEIRQFIHDGGNDYRYKEPILIYNQLLAGTDNSLQAGVPGGTQAIVEAYALIDSNFGACVYSTADLGINYTGRFNITAYWGGTGQWSQANNLAPSPIRTTSTGRIGLYVDPNAFGTNPAGTRRGLQITTLGFIDNRDVI